MPSETRRKQLGELLIRRRIELDPRYENRRVFEAERWPGRYRQINKIETGQGGNFEAATVAAAELAYQLEPGAIRRFLGGGELEPRSENPSPALRAAPVAPEPVLLPATEAMEAAMRTHREEIEIRLELAHRKFPGQELTGSMVFPLDPRSASFWDLVAADEEFAGDEAGIAQGVAALRAWRQEKARADGNRAATG